MEIVLLNVTGPDLIIGQVSHEGRTHMKSFELDLNKHFKNSKSALIWISRRSNKIL